MKRMKIYVVTYKRSDVLNDTLEKLFSSDFKDIPNTEVNIINNHSEFFLREEFKNRVNVLHNVLRPDWSNGNVSENYNQAFINGVVNLSNPDTEILVTLQNDAVVHPNWCKHLGVLFDKGYTFVTGLCGDTVTAYKPEAIRKIGMWDENLPAQYKETDYFLRALIYNKDKSSINDVVHGILLNHEPDYPIESFEDRNFVTIKEPSSGSEIIKRKADDAEQQQIWNNSRGGIYKSSAWNYFYNKWKGTWKSNPIHTKKQMGWIKKWTQEMIDNPPDLTLSNVKSTIRYIYFEKDLDLDSLNYMSYDRPVGR